MKRSCYQCTDRHPGCHAACPLYAADAAENERRKAYERQFEYVDTMPQTVSAWRKTMAPRRCGGQQ